MVCSRAANPFGWVCKSVRPQSIRVKLYPIMIDCEELTPLQSNHSTSIKLVVKVWCVLPFATVFVIKSQLTLNMLTNQRHAHNCCIAHILYQDSCRLQYRLEWRRHLPPNDRQMVFRFDGRLVAPVQIFTFRANAFTRTL